MVCVFHQQGWLQGWLQYGQTSEHLMGLRPVTSRPIVRHSQLGSMELGILVLRSSLMFSPRVFLSFSVYTNQTLQLFQLAREDDFAIPTFPLPGLGRQYVYDGGRCCGRRS